MAKQGCLLLHDLTAASKTHCYIYLKACQVSALILAHLQEVMWTGSQDKDTGLEIDRGNERILKSERQENKKIHSEQIIYILFPCCCLFQFIWEYLIILRIITLYTVIITRRNSLQSVKLVTVSAFNLPIKIFL